MAILLGYKLSVLKQGTKDSPFSAVVFTRVETFAAMVWA